MPKQTPKQAQAAAAARVGYGPIWLQRKGDYTTVSVKLCGRWVEIIREDYEGNYSHCIEPLGIEEAVETHWLHAPAPRSAASSAAAIAAPPGPPSRARRARKEQNRDT